MSIGRGVGTVAAEVISTILSHSVSRVLTRQRRGPESNEYVPDMLSRLLGNFVEQVWQMVEQAQSAMLNPDYEVVDTDENTQMDFETSANLSTLQWDLETGVVVLDADDTQIASEFDGATSNWIQSSASVQSMAPAA
jgi:hypothetical protein